MTEDNQLLIDKESAFIIAVNAAFFAAAVKDGKWGESVLLASIITVSTIIIEEVLYDKTPSLIEYLENNYFSEI